MKKHQTDKNASNQEISIEKMISTISQEEKERIVLDLEKGTFLPSEDLFIAKPEEDELV